MFNVLLPHVFYLIILMVIIAFVTVIVKQKAQLEQTYPYEAQQHLFSPAERSFLAVLEQAVNDRCRFMGKVRLADIVKVKNGLNRSAWQNAFNKIQSRHVDIVACDPATLGIRFVIELDDSTHNQPKRQGRDRFVDYALAAAGIPVVHVKAKESYSPQEVQGMLSQAGVRV
jgi:very-short-patch-repair endonuclease